MEAPESHDPLTLCGAPGDVLPAASHHEAGIIIKWHDQHPKPISFVFHFHFQTTALFYFWAR
jgi:hypothetical protein